jgi:hypothetical protein
MEYQQRAALGDPLGRRTVLDAETGAVLLHP